jgi:CheY-like chemotaxis protein
VHGIAGGTVMGDGRVVLVLELTELLSSRPGATSGASRAVAAQIPSRDSVMQAIQASPQMDVGVPFGNPATLSAVPSALAAARVGGKQILIVDDSPSVRRVVGNMLKQNGWEVQVARDGVEALEMISRETPAGILLDIEMPRMDGYELIATLRAQEQYRTLPVVVLTSRAATKHLQRAMQLGASAYVVKPYQDEELINILNSLVYGATVQ